MNFLPNQNFECSQCSRCCQGWRIGVDNATARQLKGSLLELRIVGQTGRAALAYEDGRHTIARKPDGSCAFLNEQELCSIHAEMGATAKPVGCQQFPYRATGTPDGIFVGVSFYCSAVQRNEGPPLQGTPELGDYPTVGQVLPVTASLYMGWPVYRVLDEFLAQELEGPVDVALGRALWALCQLVKRGRGLTPDFMRDLLEKSEVALLPPCEPFALMERHHFGLLVARTEELDAAQLLADKALTYTRFHSWSGRLSQIRAAGREQELRRYLRALVYRKFLVTRRPLLHNLALLYMLAQLYRFWSGLSALSAPAENCEFRALDECERRYVTHARDVDAPLAHLGKDLLEGLD